MAQDIDDVIRRTYRYYYEDGLVETAVGTLFFIIGLAFLGWHAIQLNPALSVGMVLLSVLIIFGGTLFVQKAIPHLKDRFTHPRTGKVIYKHDEPPRSRWSIVLIVLFPYALPLFLPERFDQMGMWEGAMLCSILVYLGSRVNLRRFYVMGGIALLIGLTSGYLFNDDIIGSAFTFGVTGLIMLVSSLIILKRYLHHHPSVEADYE